MFGKTSFLNWVAYGSVSLTSWAMKPHTRSVPLSISSLYWYFLGLRRRKVSKHSASSASTMFFLMRVSDAPTVPLCETKKLPQAIEAFAYMLILVQLFVFFVRPVDDHLKYERSLEEIVPPAPFTCNGAYGVTVPMPTLPLLLRVIISFSEPVVEFVGVHNLKRISLYDG